MARRRRRCRHDLTAMKRGYLSWTVPTLEELEKRDDLTAEFKGYLAAGYLEQKAKWCAPYRRALAELKKMKTEKRDSRQVPGADPHRAVSNG